MHVGNRMLFGIPDVITDMTRSSGMVRRYRLIYGIIVFGLRKGSGVHRKGFRMFPEMFGYENTLFGPKGKAHKVFGKSKRRFCGVQGPDPRVRGGWAQMPGSL